MVEGKFIAPDYLKISLPRNPRLAPWIQAVDLGDNRLQLRGAEHAFTIQHPLFIEIFNFLQPLLSGTHSQATLIKKTKGQYLPDTVLFVLKLLRANGALQEGAIPPSKLLTKKALKHFDPQIQFLSHFTQDPVQVFTQLQSAHILILGSPLFSEIIKTSLTSAGFKNLKTLDVELGEPNSKSRDLQKILNPKTHSWDLVIACQEGMAINFFTKINTLSQKLGLRWIPISVSGTTGLLGPTIIPLQSACYTCLQSRIAANAPDLTGHVEYQKLLQSNPLPTNEGIMIPLLSTLASQAALEAIRLITGLTQPQTINRLFEFKITTPIPQSHQVFRVPRCRDCHESVPRQAVWDFKTLSTQ